MLGPVTSDSAREPAANLPDAVTLLAGDWHRHWDVGRRTPNMLARRGNDRAVPALEYLAVGHAINHLHAMPRPGGALYQVSTGIDLLLVAGDR